MREEGNHINTQTELAIVLYALTTTPQVDLRIEQAPSSVHSTQVLFAVTVLNGLEESNAKSPFPLHTNSNTSMLPVSFSPETTAVFSSLFSPKDIQLT